MQPESRPEHGQPRKRSAAPPIEREHETLEGVIEEDEERKQEERKQEEQQEPERH